MRKVLLVSNTDWYLYNFRRNLAHFLRQQGWEVGLVSPAGEYAAKLRQMGLRWMRWEVGRQSLSPWQEAGSLLRLLQIYRRERPDLVHHHTIKPVLYGSLAARLAGIPAVVNSVTGRGYVFLREERKARLARRIVTPLYRFAFASPRVHVIFENAADRTFFSAQGWVPPQRAHLIESVGVDTSRFRPLPEPAGEVVILQASRMLWDKGVGVLVEAARLLREQVSARVALAGASDPGNPASIPETMLEAWAAEGLVEWWGWLPDILEAYRRAHIIVLPSLGEGFPTGLLEAAACARPIVTTDVPGCREVVRDGENGFLVPPNDPRALAEALERLVSDPVLRGRMGAAGRKLVEERFTLEKVNTATLSVYQELLP